MENRSAYQQLRQIESAIKLLRPDADVGGGLAVQKAFETLQKQVSKAQQAIRDYDLTESEKDVKARLRILARAVKSLEQLRESILTASQYDIIGVVDVAQMSAQLDEIIDRFK